MNKKVLTLCAGLLLAGSVSAQTWVGDFTKSAAPSLTEVSKVTDQRVYQLSNGSDVLVMQRVKLSDGSYNYQLAYVPFYEANLGESLWRVEKVKSNNENGIAFTFVNQAYNLPISFDSNKAQELKNGLNNLTASNLGGTAVSWKWMRSEEGPDLTIARTPEAYITPDSVMTMIPLADGKVAAVKYATKEYAGGITELNIKPYVAGSVYLNKYDLNSRMQTQERTGKMKLAFEQGTTTENLWDGNEYKAVDPVGKNTLAYGAVKDAEEAANNAQAVWKNKDTQLGIAISELANSDSYAGNLYKELQTKSNQRANLQLQVVENHALAQGKLQDAVNLMDELGALEEKVGNISTATEEQKEQLEQLNSTVDNLRRQIEDVNTSLADQAVVLSGWKSDVIDLQSQILQGQKDIAYYNDAIKDYNTVIATFGSSVAKVQDIEVVLGSLDIDPTISGEIQSLIEGEFDSNTSLSETSLVKVVTDKRDVYTSDVTRKETEIAEWEESVEKTQKNITVIEGQITVNETNLAGFEAQLTQKEEEQQSIIDQIAANDKTAADVKKDIEAKRSEIAQAKNEFNGYLTKIDELNENIAGIETEMAELDKQLSEADEVNAALQFRVRQLKYEVAAAARYYQNTYAIYAAINADKTPYWLSLQTDDNKYLMVDTAYVTQNAGDQNLAFAVKEHNKDFVDAFNPLNARDINGRFNFRFRYWPTQDSMRIESDGFNRKAVTTKYWADRNNSEINLRSSHTPGYEQNLVKVDVLGAQREVTIGNSENLKGTRLYTINDRIGFGFEYVTAEELTPGLYYMTIPATDGNQRSGANLMVDLDGDLTLVAPADAGKMNFAHMPAAKWVVADKSSEFGSYSAIYNQETGEVLNNSLYSVKKENGKVYVSVAYTYQGQNIIDNFELVPAASTTEGYYAVNPDVRELFTLNYLNVAGNMNVTVGDASLANDTILAVTSGDAVKFELNQIAVANYGIPFEKDTLKRGVYTINVNDPNKLNLKDKFVQVSEIGGTEMMVVSDAYSATPFFLKEVNDVDGTHYYALIEAVKKSYVDANNKVVYYYVTGDKKAGVVDATGLIKAEDITSETRTSAFALYADTTRYYREFTAEELGENYNMKFYRTASTEKEYLYAAPQNEMTFLAVEGKGDAAGSSAEMTVIPTTEAGVLMPQYFIARGVTEQKGNVKWCGEEHKNLQDSLSCVHTVVTPDTLFGNFLVNLKIDNELDQKYAWENKYTRLAFLEGFAVKPEGTMPGEGQYTTLVIGNDTVAFADNKHNAAKFEFRLVNEDEAQDFLIESESWNGNDAFAGGEQPMIKGGWLKIQNGVPVIVSDNFESVSQADVYNVDTNYDPTANEEINANGTVSVVAENGAVVVKGAEGKNVIVSTILGKVVANETITSDNAKIAAPAGIVVVSVEGESFKVVVK